MKFAQTKSIKEVSLVIVYPFSQIEDSLRLMQTRKHIGKIVLEPQEANMS